MPTRWICLIAIAATTGCGRIATTVAAPQAPVSAVEAPAPAGLPQTIAEAEAKARPFLGKHRDAPLAFVAAGPVSADGTLADTVKTGWELGFWLPGEEGRRYQVVRIDYRGRGVTRTAFGSLAEAPRPLAVDKLPGLGAAIAKARAAGLSEAGAYDVELRATPQGPQLRVSTRGKEVERVSLDALTGELRPTSR